MIKALGVKADGSISLILGISEPHITRLKDREVINIDLSNLPIPAGVEFDKISITLVYGETELEIAEGLQELMANTAGGKN